MNLCCDHGKSAPVRRLLNRFAFVGYLAGLAEGQQH